MKKIILSLLLTTACLLNTYAQNKNVVNLEKQYNNLIIEKNNSISSIHQNIENVIANNRINKDSVLIVFDLDNTLIKSDQELGSDLWYNWQSDSSKENKLNKDCLYDVAIPYLTNKNTYSLVEKSTVGHFINLRDKYTTIALTSRAPSLRKKTQESLDLQGLNFKDIPFASSSLINEKKETNYSKGIFMTTGKNKGEMLITLLGNDIAKYKYIFFVDDGQKNIYNMTTTFALKNSKNIVKSYWYTKVEDDWQAANPGKTYAKVNADNLSKEWDLINCNEEISKQYDIKDCGCAQK